MREGVGIRSDVSRQRPVPRPAVVDVHILVTKRVEARLHLSNIRTRIV